MGDWQPYEKLKPNYRIKVTLILWLPFISYFSYWTYAQYLAGDLACEGTACGTIFGPIFNIGVMGFVSVFLIHGIFAGLYMNQLVFTSLTIIRFYFITRDSEKSPNSFKQSHLNHHPDLVVMNHQEIFSYQDS